MSNPGPWTFRPRIRLMNLQRSPFSLKADLPVGFPYRFNSSWIISLYTIIICRIWQQDIKLYLKTSSIYEWMCNMIRLTIQWFKPVAVSVLCWRVTPNAVILSVVALITRYCGRFCLFCSHRSVTYVRIRPYYESKENIRIITSENMGYKRQAVIVKGVPVGFGHCLVDS